MASIADDYFGDGSVTSTEVAISTSAANVLSTSVPSTSKITPLSDNLLQGFLDRFSLVEVTLNDWRRLLNQIL